MIKIRLARLGSRKKPFYRIVAIDERKKGSGVPLDVIGFWHPSEQKKEIDKTKIDYWCQRGSQISPAVAKLIKEK